MNGGGKHLAVARGRLAGDQILQRGRMGMGELRPEVLCPRLLRKALELSLPLGAFLQGQVPPLRELTF